MNKIKPLILAAFAWFLFHGSVPVPNSDDEIFLYRAVAKVLPGHFPLNQGNAGTCVAFGHAAGCDVLLAQAKLAGTSGKFIPASPDSIYGGSRNEGLQRINGSYSDGSNGYSAVAFLNKYGGVIHRQPYPEFGFDLSNYDIKRSRDWGAWGNGGRKDGINGPFDTEAAKHPIKAVARVKTLADLDTALARGYPVTICSGVGFSSPRDKDGFCQPRGSWSHCMCIVGKRNEGRKGYLILNSWGAYIAGDGGTANKYKDQPDGSFYAEPDVVARILRAGDSWALGDAVGFPKKLLPDWLTDPDGKPPTEPPALAPIPDPISTKPSDTFKALLKPVSVEEFAKLDGLAKPDQFVDANKKVERSGAVNKTMPQSACANGACGYSRRRWFR